MFLYIQTRPYILLYNNNDNNSFTLLSVNPLHYLQHAREVPYPAMCQALPVFVQNLNRF